MAAHGPPSSTGSESSEAARVRALDQTELKALVRGDADTLERIIAPDFTLVPPPGEPQTRAQYLESVASGDLDYRVFKPITPVEVVVRDDLAVLTFESHLDVSAGDAHVEHEAWHTHVYEKRDGRWQLIWAQATAVGGFPPT